MAISFVCLVPVRLLRPSVAVLYQVNRELQRAIGKVYLLLLKTVALQVYRPLTHIFNFYINQGIFPDTMKLAKVVPVFKQGSRFTCNNYRPISVLRFGVCVGCGVCGGF